MTTSLSESGSPDFDGAQSSLSTLRDFLRWGVSSLGAAQVALGHGYDDLWDEALVLILHALHLPLGVDDRVLDARLLPGERRQVVELFRRRIIERVPSAYLIGEAWFGNLSFRVDERVLIPRSPLAELIEHRFEPWIDTGRVTRVLDLCTGSGCIAIAMAHVFADAEVVATDLSAAALEVAAINRARYELEERLTLIEGDLFAGVTGTFDLIVSNPPYVAEQELATLAPEYRHEPQLGLAAGVDGLDIVERILAQARRYLRPGGLLVVEVGSSAEALVARYPDLTFFWPDLEHGGEGVFIIEADQL